MKQLNKKSNIASMFSAVFKSNTFVEAASVGTGLFDGIIVSRFLGSESMAAQGLVQPFFTIALVFSGLLSVGMSTICSGELARGNVKEAQRTFGVSMIVGTIVSAIIMIFLFFFSDTAAFLLGARGNAASLLPEMSLYIKGISLGVIPQIILFVLTPILGMDSNGKTVIRASVILLFVNAALDLIFLHYGMGMFGIGLSTAIGCYITLGILLTHFLKKDRMFSLSFKSIGWNNLGKICRYGSGKAMINAGYSASAIIVNNIMTKVGGTIGLSALSVRSNVSGFLFIPTTGIAAAVALLTGLSYGEKNKKDCREIGKLAHRYILIYGAVITALLILFSGQIAHFYDRTNGELAKYARFILYTLGINVVLDALAYSKSVYLQSIRKIAKSQIINFLNNFALCVIAAIVGAKLFGLYGVLVCFLCGNALMCIVIYVYYEIKSKKLFPTAEQQLSLPDDFNIKPYDIIELDVRSKDQAITVAEQVQLFCKGHQIEKSRAFKAALCVEEITTNILSHGYAKSKKVNPVDIRVTISQGDIIIRIRDNCARFDLTERIKAIQNNPNKEKNIGIRMIQETAKDIKYVNIIGTNTLIITV